jgi:glycosyltransferase involved in cell wall biosynthesis
VQRLCVLATPTAFVFSELHGRRLREEGLRSTPIRLAGLYGAGAGPAVDAANGARAASGNDLPREPLVVFAGRHIAEKRVPSIPAAIALAREEIPGLRGLILGDGPQRSHLLDAIRAAEAEDFVDAPGFVDAGDVSAAMARASCLLLPSSREGYGMVVIEAAAIGTPSVVVAGADNAAVELVEDGVNGFVAPTESPADVAAAIVRCVRGAGALRASTSDWFARRAPELSVDASARRVLFEYAGNGSAAR